MGDSPLPARVLRLYSYSDRPYRLVEMAHSEVREGKPTSYCKLTQQAD